MAKTALFLLYHLLIDVGILLFITEFMILKLIQLIFFSNPHLLFFKLIIYFFSLLLFLIGLFLLKLVIYGLIWTIIINFYNENIFFSNFLLQLLIYIQILYLKFKISINFLKNNLLNIFLKFKVKL